MGNGRGEGQNTGRDALVLHFVFGNRPLDASLVTGMRLDAEMVYYPGNFPLRAANQESFQQGGPCFRNARLSKHRKWSGRLCRALAQSWLELFPASFESVTLLQQSEKWYVRDRAGYLIPLHPHFDRGWNYWH